MIWNQSVVLQLKTVIGRHECFIGTGRLPEGNLHFGGKLGV